jgi:hypothetical protein
MFNKEKPQVLARLGVIAPVAMMNDKTTDENKVKEMNKLLAVEGLKIVKSKIVKIEKTYLKIHLNHVLLNL